MTEFLIIGAGPTGLGAAHHLHHNGQPYTLLEQSDQAGGLAASFVDAMGFTWDIGGHVQFSHYPQFDAVMDSIFPPSGWLQHTRSAWAWMQERFVPYPVQQHLEALPSQLAQACRAGLPTAPPAAQPAADFAAWMLQQFGAAFTETFMRPYNLKVWAHPPEAMSSDWIAERVAPPTQGTASWGPNSRFRFPAQGGTGHIWNTLAARLPAIRYRSTVSSIDTARRELTCTDGSRHRYKHLISTMPLDALCRLTGLPQLAAAQALRHSATHVVGLGMRGACPPQLQGKSWIYFPEDNCPFYRATVFSNYSPHHVPAGGPYWSLMTETSASEHKPVDAQTIV
ncbi:MAG: amine oxidase, partial [Proteobacteria bacterium]|nr:amine oxidase [Pseudomonadota bacterium]